jgi:hypothetical protein
LLRISLLLGNCCRNHRRRQGLHTNNTSLDEHGLSTLRIERETRAENTITMLQISFCGRDHVVEGRTRYFACYKFGPEIWRWDTRLIGI